MTLKASITTGPIRGNGRRVLRSGRNQSKMANSISIISDISKTLVTDIPKLQREGGYFVIPGGFMGCERVIHASRSSPACHPTAALLKKREAPHQLLAKQPY